MGTVLLLVMALLAPAAVGLILFAKALRIQLLATRGEFKDLADQLGRRTKQAVNSFRATHVAKVSEMFAPLLPHFPAYNVKYVQW
jgi:hypothetical protein